MSRLLPQTWDRLLDSPFEKAEFARTLARAEAEARQTVVFPPREEWINSSRKSCLILGVKSGAISSPSRSNTLNVPNS